MNQNRRQITESSRSLSAITGRIPPQAIEIEKALIGAILMEREKLEEVLEIITDPECFYVDAHQRIYEALISLPAKGMAVDLLTVTEELRRSDDLELIGGAYYLTQLTMNVMSSAHAVPHARIVMEKYILREIIKKCGQAMADAYEDKQDVFDILETVEKELYDLTFKRSGEDLKHLSEGVSSVMMDIEEKRHSKIEFTGIPTGFPDLDKITGGWQKTDLIILGARPSVGKTAFALNLAYNACVENGKSGGIAFFSLEMGAEQIICRLMSLNSKIPLESIRNPVRLSDSDMQGVYKFNMGLNEMPIYIEDTAAQSVAQLKGKCRRLSKKIMEKQRRQNQPETGLSMVVIDYLQLMKNPLYKGNREQEISSISRDLKALAKEFKLPVLALAQLSREIEKRKGNRPYLSDLRESGAIEQDADVIGFLYRPEEEDIQKKPELENILYVDIAKNRNGKTDALPVYKDLSIQKFSHEPLIKPANDWMKPISTVIPDPNAWTEPKSQHKKPTDFDLPF